ncbi:MAG: 3D domain-containing protein [Desulfomicrobium escambiense]|nr:3D domain-containing protein [Desulfomicrobium escambiense]
MRVGVFFSFSPPLGSHRASALIVRVRLQPEPRGGDSRCLHQPAVVHRASHYTLTTMAAAKALGVSMPPHFAQPAPRRCSTCRSLEPGVLDGARQACSSPCSGRTPSGSLAGAVVPRRGGVRRGASVHRGGAAAPAPARTHRPPAAGGRDAQVSARWHHVVATAIGAIVLALLYQVTAVDSRYAARQAVLRETSAVPSPGARLRFSATAYCKGDVTALRRVAADGRGGGRSGPAAGRLGHPGDRPAARTRGIYTIMDTGPMVQGRHIDLYMWSCHEALAFGRRAVDVTVLRLGWNPRHEHRRACCPRGRCPQAAARRPK